MRLRGENAISQGNFKNENKTLDGVNTFKNEVQISFKPAKLSYKDEQCLLDLAEMRDAMKCLGGGPT